MMHSVGRLFLNFARRKIKSDIFLKKLNIFNLAYDAIIKFVNN